MTQAKLIQVQSQLSHFNKLECIYISDFKAKNEFIDFQDKPEPSNLSKPKLTELVNFEANYEANHGANYKFIKEIQSKPLHLKANPEPCDFHTPKGAEPSDYEANYKASYESHNKVGSKTLDF